MMGLPKIKLYRFRMSKLALFVLFLTAYATALVAQSLIDQGIRHGNLRIAGGSVAKTGAYPFVVSLRRYPNKHFCGGTIVHKLWILTAAHCMEGKSTTTVVAVAGTNKLSSGGVVLKLHRTVLHPNYNKTGKIENDIAMIQLRFALRYTATIASVSLNIGTSRSIMNVTLIGWGQTTHNGSLSNNLLELSTQTLSHAACKLYWPYVFNEDHICTKFETGKGQCFGDSGGPLLLANSETQVGIISFSYDKCGEMFADVFVRVSSYMAWIHQTVNAHN
ncbi:hypothetical protein Trydic_g4869 [Trypoxylus dichotomus]